MIEFHEGYTFFDLVHKSFLYRLFILTLHVSFDECILLILTCLFIYILFYRLSKRKLGGLWGKRSMNNWEKRLTKSWGKRSESDSDELYQRILREIYHTVRLNQLAHPQYSVDDDCKLFVVIFI